MLVIVNVIITFSYKNKYKYKGKDKDIDKGKHMDNLNAVSYTHLDVYKRQQSKSIRI